MADSMTAFPGAGDRIPDFSLPVLDGGTFDIFDYRGVWNLVLVMAGYDDIPARELLREMSVRQLELATEDARVIIAVPADNSSLMGDLRRAAREDGFQVLLDEGGRIHQMLQAVNLDGKPALTTFVTDRFLEIYGVVRSGDPVWPPSAESLLDWLRFVEIQCPE